MSIKKSKLTKVFIVVFLILAIVTPFLFELIKYTNDYDFTIDEYNLDIVLDEYGDMHVVEKVTNNYSNTNKVFYKQLIYSKNNSFSSTSDKSSLVEDVRVTVERNNFVIFDSDTYDNTSNKFVGYSYNNDKDERGYPIECEGNVKNCEMIFYYDVSGIPKVTTFTYEYTIKGVITQYGDISEFNWVVLGYQPMNVKGIDISITLPEGDYDIAKMNNFFHGISRARIDYVDTNKISISADTMVKNEEIEVRLLVDRDVFTDVRASNSVSINRLDDILKFEEAQIKKADLEYNLSYYGSVSVYIFCVFYLLFLTFNCYRKYDKEFPTSFYNEYYREIPRNYPPAVMGYLYKFKEIDDNDLTATLLDLIRRKYLILENPSTTVNDKNPDYIIKLNTSKSQDDLTNQEKHLIKWFISDIGDGKQVNSKKLSSYCKKYENAVKYQNNNLTWISLVEEEANKYDFFDKNIKVAKASYSGYGIIALVLSLGAMLLYALYGYDISMMVGLSSICLCMAYFIYVSSFKRRSKNGNEDFVRWKAFKKFLEEFSTFKDYPVPSLIIWEHYLVYATSFGIADKVTSQLKLKFKDNEIDNSDSTFVMYYGLRYNYFYNINRTITSSRVAALSTISKHTAGRVGGGGGGFSGGSSFGGGGGSFGGR